MHASAYHTAVWSTWFMPPRQAVGWLKAMAPSGEATGHCSRSHSGSLPPPPAHTPSLQTRRLPAQSAREVTSPWLPGVWGHLPGVLCGCQEPVLLPTEPIHSSWPLPGKNRRHCPFLTAILNEVLKTQKREGSLPSLESTVGNLSVLLGRWEVPWLGRSVSFSLKARPGLPRVSGSFHPPPPHHPPASALLCEASCLGSHLALSAHWAILSPRVWVLFCPIFPDAPEMWDWVRVLLSPQHLCSLIRRTASLQGWPGA